jgi:hypothetical protein
MKRSSVQCLSISLALALTEPALAQAPPLLAPTTTGPGQPFPSGLGGDDPARVPAGWTVRT